MKKSVVVILIVALVLALIAAVILGVHSTGPLFGTVTLHNKRETFTLSGQEAKDIQRLFAFRFYRYGIGGCPYKDGAWLSIGGREFALATDDCYTAKDLKNENCMEFSRTEWEQITKLYTRYFGYTSLID